MKIFRFKDVDGREVELRHEDGWVVNWRDFEYWMLPKLRRKLGVKNNDLHEVVTSMLRSFYVRKGRIMSRRTLLRHMEGILNLRHSVAVSVLKSAYPRVNKSGTRSNTLKDSILLAVRMAALPKPEKKSKKK